MKRVKRHKSLKTTGQQPVDLMKVLLNPKFQFCNIYISSHNFPDTCNIGQEEPILEKRTKISLKTDRFPSYRYRLIGNSPNEMTQDL